MMFKYFPKKDDVKTHAEAYFPNKDRANYFASLCMESDYISEVKPTRIAVKVIFNPFYVTGHFEEIKSEIERLYAQAVNGQIPSNEGNEDE